MICMVGFGRIWSDLRGKAEIWKAESRNRKPSMRFGGRRIHAFTDWSKNAAWGHAAYRLGWQARWRVGVHAVRVRTDFVTSSPKVSGKWQAYGLRICGSWGN